MATTEEIQQLVDLAKAIIAARAAYLPKKAVSDVSVAAYATAQNVLNARILAGDDPESTEMRALIENRLATYIDSAAKEAAARTADTLINQTQSDFDAAFDVLAFG